MKPSVIVQKYGGSSLASLDAIKNIAQKIKARKEKGFNICVVVSAMGNSTNELLKQAKEISSNPSARELDMLLTAGERRSMSLLAMALESVGVPSISFTGSQSGIITDERHAGAKILEIKPQRLLANLNKNKVVIVAGFQGVSKTSKEVTTLGRGGSDTSAVCLAAALNADACEIYSDVDGIYSADPHKIHDAKQIKQISYEEMRALSHAGAQVLHEQAVVEAEKLGVTIHAMKSTQTTESVENSGTYICDKSENCEKSVLALAIKEHGSLFEYDKLELSFNLSNNLDLISADYVAKKFVCVDFSKNKLKSKKITKTTKISLIQKNILEQPGFLTKLLEIIEGNKYKKDIVALKTLENSVALYVSPQIAPGLMLSLHKEFV